MNTDLENLNAGRIFTSDDWSGRYTSSVANGALYVRESRIVAGLLLDKVSKVDWKKAIYEENVLQARSPRFARKVGNLARARLRKMSPALLTLIRDGSFQVSTHACLAASVKHSFLLGDFLDLALREQYQRFATEISYPIWTEYLETCHSRDTEMPTWTESTHSALRSAVFHILAQAGFIESPTVLKLQTVHIAKDVINCLQDDSEEYVIRCLTVGR